MALPEQTVISQLVNQGLFIDPNILYQPDPVIPLGYVIATNPANTVGLPVGTYVQLILSTGLGNVIPQTTVPNVTGLDLAKAIATIDNSECCYANSTFVANSAPPGNVLSQTPTGGTIVNVGATIYMTISAGPTPVITLVTVPLVH